ncbi:MAG: DUF1810 domain-containing protein [Verrucomicrobiota bacterium]
MSSTSHPDPADPHDLARFLRAQEGVYDTGLGELRRGRKRSHWRWFIFPQRDGLATSPLARQDALHGLDEAQAYLALRELGPRWVECCRALLAVEGRTAVEIMGHPDDRKLRSSATLFTRVPGAPPELQAVLDRYHDGQPDARTLALLNPVG